MELTPELLDEQEFPVVLRGYDTASVDDFLERVGAGLGVLLARLDQAGTRLGELESELAERRSGPDAAPADFRGQVDQVSRALVLAQEAADQTTSEARAEADRMVAEATATADGLVAQAHADVEARIGTAEAEVESRAAALRAVRDKELADLAARQHSNEAELALLREKLAEQRDHLRAVAASAAAILDEDVATDAGASDTSGITATVDDAAASEAEVDDGSEDEPVAEATPAADLPVPPAAEQSAAEQPVAEQPVAEQSVTEHTEQIVADHAEPPTESMPIIAESAVVDDGGALPAEESTFWRSVESSADTASDASPAGSSTGLFDQDDAGMTPAAPMLRAVEAPDDDPFLAALRGDDDAAARLSERPPDDEPSGLMRRLRRS